MLFSQNDVDAAAADNDCDVMALVLHSKARMATVRQRWCWQKKAILMMRCDCADGKH